jgi:hypothetical protein
LGQDRRIASGPANCRKAVDLSCWPLLTICKDAVDQGRATAPERLMWKLKGDQLN